MASPPETESQKFWLQVPSTSESASRSTTPDSPNTGLEDTVFSIEELDTNETARVETQNETTTQNGSDQTNSISLSELSFSVSMTSSSGATTAFPPNEEFERIFLDPHQWSVNVPRGMSFVEESEAPDAADATPEEIIAAIEELHSEVPSILEHFCGIAVPSDQACGDAFFATEESCPLVASVRESDNRTIGFVIAEESCSTTENTPETSRETSEEFAQNQGVGSTVTEELCNMMASMPGNYTADAVSPELQETTDDSIEVQEEGIYKCFLCDKKFSRKAAFEAHQRNHTKENVENRCEYCSKVFSHPANLAKHYKIHSRDKTFNCEFCSKSFTSSEGMTIHMRIHAEQCPFKCGICSMGFISSSTLKRHMREHSDDAGSSPKVEGHKKTHPGQKRFVCDVCQKSFNTSYQLKAHMKTHPGQSLKTTSSKVAKTTEATTDPTADVQILEKNFLESTRKYWSGLPCTSSNASIESDSVNQESVDQSFEQESSNQVSVEQESITQEPMNQSSDNPETTYEESIDEKSTNQTSIDQDSFESLDPEFVGQDTSVGDTLSELDSSLSSELERSVVTSPSVLDQIPEEASSFEMMYTSSQSQSSPSKDNENSPLSSQSRQVAEPKKNFICKICGKTFTLQHNLRKHSAIHLSELPYRCETCDCPFKFKHDLIKHEQTHTKERPYRCEICEESFEHSSKLKRHMRKHSGKGKYKCVMCSKGFFTFEELTDHIRTMHTSEKHVCTVCEKQFPNEQQLADHLQIHTGNKPFSCNACGASFWNDYLFQRHTTSQCVNNPYKCSMCRAAFVTQQNLDDHVFRSHGNNEGPSS